MGRLQGSQARSVLHHPANSSGSIKCFSPESCSCCCFLLTAALPGICHGWCSPDRCAPLLVVDHRPIEPLRRCFARGCRDSSLLCLLSHLQGMCCANFDELEKGSNPKSDSSKQEITFFLPPPPHSSKSFPAFSS